MSYSLTVQAVGGHPVSPGIELGLLHTWEDVQFSAIKILRSIFEEISLFYKKIIKYIWRSNADLFALRQAVLPVSHCS